MHPVPLELTLTPAVNWNISHLLPRYDRSTFVDAKDSGEERGRVFHELFSLHDAGARVVVLRVNRYHVAMNLWATGDLLNNAHVGEMLRLYRSQCCYFKPCAPPSPAATMRAAFNALFLFSPAVLERVSSMKRELGLEEKNRTSPYVAIHARIGGGGIRGDDSKSTSWSDPGRHALSDCAAFLECADAKIDEVKRRNENSNSSSNMGAVRKVLFSDRADFKKKASDMDPSLRYVRSSVIMHVDKSEVDDETVLLRGVIDTLAELYILSRADCIVGSSSTFSAVAGSIFIPPGQKHGCYSHFADCRAAGGDEQPYDFWLDQGL